MTPESSYSDSLWFAIEADRALLDRIRSFNRQGERDLLHDSVIQNLGGIANGAWANLDGTPPLNQVTFLRDSLRIALTPELIDETVLEEAIFS